MQRGAILCGVLAAVAFGGCSGGPSERSTRTVSDALDSGRGTEFWLMFEQNSPGPVQLTLFIAGERATSGQVDVPGLAFSQVFTVTPGAVTSIALPAGDDATGCASTTARRWRRSWRRRPSPRSRRAPRSCSSASPTRGRWTRTPAPSSGATARPRRRRSRRRAARAPCSATHVIPASGTFKIMQVSDNLGDGTTWFVTVVVR